MILILISPLIWNTDLSKKVFLEGRYRLPINIILFLVVLIACSIKKMIRFLEYTILTFRVILSHVIDC